MATRLAIPVPFARSARMACLLILFAFVPMCLQYFWAAGHGWPRSHLTDVALAVSTAPTDDDSWDPILLAIERNYSQPDGPLYQHLHHELNRKFQYAPSVLLPVLMLRRIGIVSLADLNLLNSFVFAFVGVVCAALYLRFHRLMRAAAGEPEGTAIGTALVGFAAFAATLAFYPITQAQLLGQIQLWIDLAVALALLFWLRDHRAMCGCLVALACMIKPQFALFLLWALAWRDWAFLRGFLAAALPLGLASLWRFGLAAHLEYLDILHHIARHGEAYHGNNSVNGLMHALLSPGNQRNFDWKSYGPYNPVVHAVTVVTSLGFIALPFVRALRRRSGADILDFITALLCFTIAAPVAWQHHYAILLPIYLLLLPMLLIDAQDRAARISIALLAASWLLVSTWVYVPAEFLDTPLIILIPTHFWSALLVLVIIGLLLRRQETGRAPFALIPERPKTALPR